MKVKELYDKLRYCIVLFSEIFSAIFTIEMAESSFQLKSRSIRYLDFSIIVQIFSACEFPSCAYTRLSLRRLQLRVIILHMLAEVYMPILQLISLNSSTFTGSSLSRIVCNSSVVLTLISLCLITMLFNTSNCLRP